MTVAVQTPEISYVEDGSTTAFPVPFRYVEPTDLRAIRRAANGVETVLAYGSGYTATPGPTDAGGTLNTSAAAASGTVLVIERRTARSQTADYIENGAFTAESHEQALDKAMLVNQEQDALIDRSLKTPAGVPGLMLDTTGLSEGDLLVYRDGQIKRLDAAPFAGKFYAGAAGNGVPIPAAGTGTDVGLRADLAASTALTLIGRRRAGTSTDLTMQQWADLQTVAPEEFGAVAIEDGASATASQTAAFTAALESGRIVDCRGKTYVIGAVVNPADATAAALVNGNFVRAAANHSSQGAMFDLTMQPNLLVDHCTFDNGSVEDTGSNDDSGRQWLAVGSGNTNPATWLRGVRVSRCRFTGAGNGTPLWARGLIGFKLEGNVVVDRIVGGTPSNDAQNGIDVSWGRAGSVSGCIVDGLWYRDSGNLVRRHSRGILVTEQNGTMIVMNHVYNCDQGIDLSGAITANLPDGNVGVSVIGNTVSDVRTWGIKFANCIRDSLCSGNLVRNFGWAGIVLSPQSGVWPAGNAAKATSYITVENNTILDPTDYYSRTDCKGVWVTFRSDYAGYPVGCRIINNTVRDRTGGGRLLHGVSLSDSDNIIYPGAPYNEVRGNRVLGQTGAPTFGCVPDGLCVLTGNANQSIPNNAWTAVQWNVETVDGQGMHGISVNSELIFPNGQGWYEICYGVPFAANATGVRRARVVVSGAPAPGGDDVRAAISGEAIPLSGRCVVYLNAAASVRVEVFQNSGGALDLQRPSSQFSARRIEQVGAV